MEEKILMRIHDDENDCDLVSVKNPLGHFGMSIFAERDGVRKPVDGMHMLSKMIEQVGNGGGDVMIVNLTFDEETETLSIDKTFSEMLEHFFVKEKPIVLFDEYDFYDLQNIDERSARFTKIALGSAGLDTGRVSVKLAEVNIQREGNTVNGWVNIGYIAVSDE